MEDVAGPLLGLTVGLVAGSFSGLLGVGGGLVLTPLLVLALGLDQHSAQGVTLVALILPLGLPAYHAYRKAGIAVSWPLVSRMIAGFVVASLGGAWVANQLSNRALRLAFVAGLVYVGGRTLHTLWRDRALATISPEGAHPPHELARGFSIGAIGGFTAGLFGVGGAVITIPLMRARLAMTQHQAQATSLAMMLPPIGLPAALMYARGASGLPWALLAETAMGFLVGGLAGGRLSVKLSGRVVSGLFAAYTIVAAVFLALRT